MKNTTREPDFNNILRILRRETPTRPTLFEFALNHRLLEKAHGRPCESGISPAGWWCYAARGFALLGYDYIIMRGSSFGFPHKERHHESSISLNESPSITDRASFAAFAWPDPRAANTTDFDAVAAALPRGMKIIISCPGGVLENVIDLAGYDNLCLLLADEPDLVADLFNAVGSRLVEYYQLTAGHPAIGACVCNDDWGFKTQTMLATADMRRYVFPWHREIVRTIHAAGKPAILHSCGNLAAVFDDIVDDLKYDGKHSYEDTIIPVEDAYRKWGRRIAIMGGIDVDFLCRAPLADIRRRSRAMLDLAATAGGYALGSGNSIPLYVPDDNYFTMTAAALEA